MPEPVQIDGPQGALVGELINVANAGNIVVIIPGSGPTDRDGNSLQMGLQPDTYKMLAEELEKLVFHQFVSTSVAFTGAKRQSRTQMM